MSIHRSIQDVSFDDAAMRAMGVAFDQACDELGNFGTGVTVREIMAKRVVEVAKRGEHNPARLCQQALDALIDEPSGHPIASVGTPPPTL